uniref:Proteinase inhibitor type-2 CEVI57 n=1 Tax=Solanum lycopersicum TaxID=4081 RepID=A0A3Q7HFS8_SOLLC
MASSKVGVLTLFFLCVFVVGSNYVEAQICPQFCEPNVDYMTCSSSGSTILRPTCINCCQATGRGCQLFRRDGSTICN